MNAMSESGPGTSSQTHATDPLSRWRNSIDVQGPSWFFPRLMNSVWHKTVLPTPLLLVPPFPVLSEVHTMTVLMRRIINML